MPAANRHNPRTTFATTISRKFIHHGMARSDKRPQQRTVDPVDAKRDQANPDPTKDQYAQCTRQESKRCIGKNGQHGRIRSLSAIKIKKKECKSHAKKSDTN